MILMVVLAFIISWTPYFLVSIITQYSSVNYMQHHNYFFTMLSINLFGFLNSSINPVIYVIMSTRFRSGFTRILKFLLCASCSASHSDSEQLHSSIERAVAAAAANASHQHLGSRHHLNQLQINNNHKKNTSRSDVSSSPEALVIRTNHHDNPNGKVVVEETILQEAAIHETHNNHFSLPQVSMTESMTRKRKRGTSLSKIGRYHRRLVLLACPSNVSTDSCPTDSGQNEAILRMSEPNGIKDVFCEPPSCQSQVRPSSCCGSDWSSNNKTVISSKNILKATTSCLGTTNSLSSAEHRRKNLQYNHLYAKNIQTNNFNAKENNVYRKENHRYQNSQARPHHNTTSHSQECFPRQDSDDNDESHHAFSKTRSDPHLHINPEKEIEQRSSSLLLEEKDHKNTDDTHAHRNLSV
jgi:hypothetical protein